ncbi:ABC transporter permease [Geomonas propionica]|uniref:ABC transporter permease n=1 Tax=Geomonas propionica TaxID=2798582 RepID=A0ABS0YXT1_9BACT|nr:ABC transporter permease [Geomonas propionica]MBJ6802749.1 ABC transporter permease [Geomonas propionica]
MLIRILKSSFLKRPKPVLLVLLSIVMGSAVATAFLGISGELSHKMALELRSYGANIVLEPAAGEAGALKSDDLPKIKTIFWKHNIVGFAPYLFGQVDFASAAGRQRAVLAGTWFGRPLQVPGEPDSIQGVKVTAPWWELDGRWPETPDEAVIGAALAKRLKLAPGSDIVATAAGKERRFRIVGVASTGGFEEEQLFAPLAEVQALLNKPGQLSRVLVSALTVPMDDFGRKDPSRMTREEYEKWYCTAYVTSVAKGVEEAMSGSRAKPIWQIASAEGALLKKLESLMLLLTGLALFSAACAVSSSLMAAMAKRSPEIALMKTMGADRLQIAAIFLGETLVISVIGGLFGYLAGDRLAVVISRTVFNSTVTSPLWLFPTAIGAALVVALAGSAAPLKRALAIEPVRVLKG